MRVASDGGAGEAGVAALAAAEGADVVFACWEKRIRIRECVLGMQGKMKGLERLTVATSAHVLQTVCVSLLPLDDGA